MGDEDERTVVKTYVPRSQKERWVEHADALDMSQSEFLRTMVQAGRRGFDPDAGNPEDAGSTDATPRGETLEQRVLAEVADAGVLGWEELVARVAGDVEREVDDALVSLQDDRRVRYSGPHGGYVATGEESESLADDGPDDGSAPPEGRGRPPTDRSSDRQRGRMTGDRRDGTPPRRRGTARNRPNSEHDREGDGRRGLPADVPRERPNRATDRRATGGHRQSPDDDSRGHERRPPDDRRHVERLREARADLDGDDESDGRAREERRGDRRERRDGY